MGRIHFQRTPSFKLKNPSLKLLNLFDSALAIMAPNSVKDQDPDLQDPDVRCPGTQTVFRVVDKRCYNGFRKIPN